MMRRWLTIVLAVLLAMALLIGVARSQPDDVDVSDDGSAAGGADDKPAGGGADDAKKFEDVQPDSTTPPVPGEEEEEEIVLKPHPDIKTVVYFPEHPDKKFPLGNDITVLVGVSNTGGKTFNFTYVGAAFHSPFDHSYIIQNFSVRTVGAVVEGSRQQTLEYVFKPDKALEPLEFWLAGFVIYNNTESGTQYRSHFINGTIEMVDRPSDLNVRRVFAYFLAIAAAGLVGFIGWSVSQPQKRSQERSGADHSKRASSWEERAYKQSSTQRVMGRSRAGPAGASRPKEKRDADASE